MEANQQPIVLSTKPDVVSFVSHHGSCHTYVHCAAYMLKNSIDTFSDKNARADWHCLEQKASQTGRPPFGCDVSRRLELVWVTFSSYSRSSAMSCLR